MKLRCRPRGVDWEDILTQPRAWNSTNSRSSWLPRPLRSSCQRSVSPFPAKLNGSGIQMLVDLQRATPAVLHCPGQLSCLSARACITEAVAGGLNYRQAIQCTHHRRMSISPHAQHKTTHRVSASMTDQRRTGGPREDGDVARGRVLRSRHESLHIYTAASPVMGGAPASRKEAVTRKRWLGSQRQGSNVHRLERYLPPRTNRSLASAVGAASCQLRIASPGRAARTRIGIGVCSPK